MSVAKYCKWCDEFDDFPCLLHCQESKDGKHRHDPRGFVQADCDDTVDVTCKLCGMPDEDYWHIGAIYDDIPPEDIFDGWPADQNPYKWQEELEYA